MIVGGRDGVDLLDLANLPIDSELVELRSSTNQAKSELRQELTDLVLAMTGG